VNYLTILFLCLIFLGCKVKQGSFNHNQEQMVTTQCPEDGHCSFEVLENKSLKKLKSSLGELYYEVVEGKNVLLKFQYERKQIPNTVDGHYIEQVFIQLDKNNIVLDLAGMKLENVEATFARFCYCKGSTGYYKIKDGNLSIRKIDDKNYTLDYSFKISEVPQIIIEIHELFTLN